MTSTAAAAASDRVSAVAKRLSASPGQVTLDDVWAFFRAARDEARHLSPAERERLFDYKHGVGTMDAREAYYRQAYCRPFLEVLQAIAPRCSAPRVLDVCCGSGGQSIVFALTGGTVLGIDRDGQLDLARRRSAIWQRAAGRPLAVTFENQDVRAIDFARGGPYDVVYSHSGIGTLMSAEAAFRRFGPSVRPGGLLILKNGNPQCLWLRLVGRHPRDSSRREYLEQAGAFGFRPVSVRGATAIPRPLWIGDLVRGPDALLRPLLPLQVMVQYIFEKR